MTIRIHDAVCNRFSGNIGTVVGIASAGMFKDQILVRWQHGTFHHKPENLTDPANAPEIKKRNRRHEDQLEYADLTDLTPVVDIDMESEAI